MPPNPPALASKPFYDPALHENRPDRTGFHRAIENGWLELHESGTFVKFTRAGADCLRELLTSRVSRNAYNLLMLLPSDNSIFVPASELRVSICARFELTLGFHHRAGVHSRNTKFSNPASRRAKMPAAF
jgi:hypothetical protein